MFLKTILAGLRKGDLFFWAGLFCLIAQQPRLSCLRIVLLNGPFSFINENCETIWELDPSEEY